jgi:hypothetical protein
MPVVKPSISEVLEIEGRFVGCATLLVLDGISKVPSFPSDARPFSFDSDFRRTAGGLDASVRGWAGALVFFTTTGGID